MEEITNENQENKLKNPITDTSNQAIKKTQNYNKLIKNTLTMILIILLLITCIVIFILNNTINNLTKSQNDMAKNESVLKDKISLLEKSKDYKDKANDKIIETENKNYTDAKNLISRVKPDLKITILKEGTGDQVEIGDTVKVQYTGKTKNGTVFDTSIGEGKTPFIVDNIGFAQLIPGWNAGIPGMKKFGKYSLFIPSQHAYGDQEKSEIIKNNTDLFFEIEILDVIKGKKL
jgi:FKBP-type peptidyl-prolyl cis-trans isomerase FklB